MDVSFLLIVLQNAIFLLFWWFLYISFIYLFIVGFHMYMNFPYILYISIMCFKIIYLGIHLVLISFIFFLIFGGHSQCLFLRFIFDFILKLFLFLVFFCEFWKNFFNAIRHNENI